MSKAFTKEDTDVAERSGRTRLASGLPPGALNYMTADGARLFREEFGKLQREVTDGFVVAKERAEQLARILSSATVVEPLRETPEGVTFGATVTLRNEHGETECLRIVGVDELDLGTGWVSWISPIGKALLGAQIGEQVMLGDRGSSVIVAIQYPTRGS